MKKLAVSLFSLLAAGSSAFAGPYSGDTVGTAWNSSSVLEWANQVVNFTPGPVNIEDPTGTAASFGTPANALGQSDALQNSFNVVSLGDGGSITLSFATPIANGKGADFSVFENGFDVGNGLAFLELAFVSVSSDGVNYFTFPSVSLTQTTTQIDGSGLSQNDLLDATNIHDLAGKTVAGVGTDFDLSELANVSPLLDVDDIKYVKVTDVVGSIDPQFGTRDSKGNLINDPFPTPFASGGFDLDAIAVLNDTATVPEPGTWALFGLGLALLAGWRFWTRARVLVAASAVLTAGFAHADNIDFSSLSGNLPPASSGGGAVNNQPFTVGGASFNNSYDPTFGSWAGFAYSNTNETSTPNPDFDYQYSAAGTGISTFAVGFIDNFNPNPTITFGAGLQPTALTITNNVYAALSMENGDSFSKKFGPGDFFLLTITGYNSAGQSTGAVDFYLANFLSADPSQDYIVNQWTTVDLSSLAAGTDQLVFTETSSDVGQFGVNTPEYFALGGLQVAEVPEPSLSVLLLVGAGLLVLRKRGRA